MSEHGEACGLEERLSWWELWPMAGWGVFVVYIFLQGWMPFFLWWLYGYLAAASGLALLVLFFCGWALRQRSLSAEGGGHEASHGHVPPASGGRWWLYVQSLAFLVPLAVGFALPVRGLNDLAAVQRGAADPAMMAELASQRELEATEKQGEYNWTTVLGLAQRLALPRPEKVGAMGFVVRTPTTPPGHFLLVRFLITCCAADASPAAVLVRWPKAETLKGNQWVKVYGQTEPKGKVLAADEVIEVSEPKKPYL